MEHVVEFDGITPLIGVGGGISACHYSQTPGQCAEPATQEGLCNDLLKDEKK